MSLHVNIFLGYAIMATTVPIHDSKLKQNCNTKLSLRIKINHSIPEIFELPVNKIAVKIIMNILCVHIKWVTTSWTMMNPDPGQ